jgi:hypothetical protein
MKKLGKEKCYRKSICTLVTACVLICTCFSAMAHTTKYGPVPSVQQMKPLSDGTKGNLTLLDENFSTTSMPPPGWRVTNTNPNGKWKIDNVRFHSAPYSAEVYRGLSCHGLQNEWLMTPYLNFSKYLNYNHTNKIFMHFWWYSDTYVVQYGLIYFNVSVSTDGGTTWKKVWAAINHSNFPENEFSLVGMPIDLSTYRNNTNVTIGFQFFSNTEEGAVAQNFEIDDILIWTPGPTNFSCSAGGPYHWWYHQQKLYTPPGVRFHGTVSKPYNPLLCHWLWDFGDGNTSQIPLYTYHEYTKIGIYKITLQVTYGKNVTFDNTTLNLFLNPPPDINVTPKIICLGGIHVDIKNPGDYNATNVSLIIKVFLGPFQMREKLLVNQTIDNLGNHSKMTVKCKYFLGMGRIHFEVIVKPENIGGVDKSFYSYKLGPFIFTLPQ